MSNYWKKKNKQAYIGIIGLGYVGLPLAREFLRNGFKVLGFDVAQEKVEKIRQGKSYIKHVSEDFIKQYVSSGQFSATNDFSLLEEVDVIIICVPTPLGKHYNPDLSFVLNTTKTIAQYFSIFKKRTSCCFRKHYLSRNYRRRDITNFI